MTFCLNGSPCWLTVVSGELASLTGQGSTVTCTVHFHRVTCLCLSVCVCLCGGLLYVELVKQSITYLKSVYRWSMFQTSSTVPISMKHIPFGIARKRQSDIFFLVQSTDRVVQWCLYKCGGGVSFVVWERVEPWRRNSVYAALFSLLFPPPPELQLAAGEGGRQAIPGRSASQPAPLASTHTGGIGAPDHRY